MCTGRLCTPRIYTGRHTGRHIAGYLPPYHTQEALFPACSPSLLAQQWNGWQGRLWAHLLTKKLINVHIAGDWGAGQQWNGWRAGLGTGLGAGLSPTNSETGIKDKEALGSLLVVYMPPYMPPWWVYGVNPPIYASLVGIHRDILPYMPPWWV